MFPTDNLSQPALPILKEVVNPDLVLLVKTETEPKASIIQPKRQDI
ncbi:MAG: hypothetical protein F6K10_18580 [Moorea sp. SIO2B7]|nr:hypothetical protein [Moorena sp. SIO2B7]